MFFFNRYIWCELYDRTQDNGEPYEVLDKHNVVGPSLAVKIYNGGLEPQKTSGNVDKDLYLTVLAPDGKKHISRTSTIIEPYPQILNVGDGYGLKIPFFSWVTDSDEKVDVPIGTYRYYATFLGARSITLEVEIHHQAFAIDSPNSEDEEIIIKPYYDRFPIGGLEYDEFIKNVKSVFKKIYEGDIQDVSIPAYRFIKLGHGAMKDSWQYPLSIFAEVKVRKKARD